MLKIYMCVLAPEEATVTQQVSHRLYLYLKCQSRLWSQRGTKVNRPHYGDNPLLRPTGIEIATKKLCDSASNDTDHYQIQFPRTRNFLETSGSATQYIIQGTGVKRVTPRQSDIGPGISPVTISTMDDSRKHPGSPGLVSSTRRRRANDEMNAHRMLGAITAAAVVVAAAVTSSVTHTMLSLSI